MKYSVAVAVVLSVLVLGACERPSNVSAPAAVVLVPVPGPAGPQGEEGKPGTTGPSGMMGSTGMTGAPGMTGSPGMMGTEGEKGEQGKTGGDTTVVVVPAK
jgi:Collagen triple helix repeat (20 copies)